MVRLAVAQAAPIIFDKQASTEKACQWIADAGRAGAALVAFGESWLPGYPFFVDAAPDAVWWRAAQRYAENAVDLDGPEVAALCDAARAAGIDVAIGLAERSSTGGTLYCTLAFISREGVLLGRHRKLKPTHNERAVWGDGDAVGLRVYPRDYGKLGGLNCWEHNIMLPGFTLAAQGVSVHVAAWPGREPATAPAEPVWARQILLSRAFASQAGCFVLCAAGLRLGAHVPAGLAPAALFEHTGQSCIVDPYGEIVAGPAEGEALLIADVDMGQAARAKLACDLAGHYSRPDIFKVSVNGRPMFGD